MVLSLTYFLHENDEKRASKYFEAKEYAKAFDLFENSAKEGNAQSQYFLGHLYQEGLGIQKNIIKARSWYKKAALQGNVQAQLQFGLLALEDYDPEGIKWLEQAANKGNLEAEINLGILYANGIGVRQDQGEAFY